MINNCNIKVNSLPATQPKVTDILPGQIWRDGHLNHSNRLLLVLDSKSNRIVCQNLQTGIIRSVRREQFNRGRTGFFFAANLSGIIDMFQNYNQVTN
jgi:hypothetical protein